MFSVRRRKHVIDTTTKTQWSSPEKIHVSSFINNHRIVWCFCCKSVHKIYEPLPPLFWFVFSSSFFHPPLSRITQNRNHLSQFFPATHDVPSSCPRPHKARTTFHFSPSFSLGGGASRGGGCAIMQTPSESTPQPPVTMKTN